MIVGDSAGHPEPRRRPEIPFLEDDALRQQHARIGLGAADRILDRRPFDFDVVAALQPGLDAVEDQIVRGGVRTVDLRPCPGQHSPRAADFAAEQGFNRGPLPGVGTFVDQKKALAVALVNRPRPVRVDGKIHIVEHDVTGRSRVDVPRPAAFAFAGGRRRVEVAGTPPVAIARGEYSSVQSPALEHRWEPLVLDDRGGMPGCQGTHQLRIVDRGHSFGFAVPSGVMIWESQDWEEKR